MKKIIATRSHKLGAVLLGLGFTLLLLAWRAPAAQADQLQVVTPTPADATPTATPQVSPTASGPGHEGAAGNLCLMCHAYQGLTGVAENSDAVSLYVDENALATSVHGVADLGCAACHQDITGYPHSDKGQIGCSMCHGSGGIYTQPVSVKLPFESARAMTLALNENCRRCHQEQFENTQDSAHMHVFESGNQDAPVCTDCHGAHDVHRPDQPLTQEVLICAKCHQAVYSSYKTSVHGQALFNEQNTDVPTCVSCHGVHNVKGPRDPSFRDDSIATCGSCHSDKERMAKYKISTDVYNTYVNDFHGRTVNLTREEKNALPSNKAVCYDCHGIHNILPPTDPLSTVNPANLVKTCQQCHPDANARFPNAWLGHKNPSFSSTPALYGVQLFYKLVIPATLGFFGVYIVLDARKRRSERRAAYRRAVAEVAPEQQPQPAPKEPPAEDAAQAPQKDESEDDNH